VETVRVSRTTGAEIRAWDTAANPENPNPKLEFEGAWDEHGMACLNKPRWALKEWEDNGSYAPCINKTRSSLRKPCGGENQVSQEASALHAALSHTSLRRGARALKLR